MLDICKRHHVYVLADEIHQDIVMSEYRQITAATTGDYDDILVTLTAATKTFNLAGCQNSIVIIPNEKIRDMYDGYLEKFVSAVAMHLVILQFRAHMKVEESGLRKR